MARDRIELPFKPQPDWDFKRQLQFTLAVLRGEDEQVPEDFIEWHELYAMKAKHAPLMAAYEAAAAMFNVILSVAQAMGERRSEKPTNGQALQHVISREDARQRTYPSSV